MRPWSMKTRTVHPHWRGEHQISMMAVFEVVGSSPLARGTRPFCRSAGSMPRFIPAGAGNTRFLVLLSRSSTVHPRWRGEHPMVWPCQLRSRGSSPLARGTRRSAPVSGPGGRFIPAGAGNTAAAWPRARPTSVHPRWRGEHTDESWYYLRVDGSSPLARGTRSQGRGRCARCRFIPAGAGNTHYGHAGISNLTVHPRWRGEHKVARMAGVVSAGSSPLARGTRRPRRHRHPRQRFIPAGAGNTCHQSGAPPPSAVHPRWRGEHQRQGLDRIMIGGSSPLARGTRCRPPPKRCAGRFIPAGAGNTPPAPTWSSPAAVHPRWRGEHERQGTAYFLLGWFIPAGAGNTCSTTRWGRRSAVHPRWRGEHLTGQGAAGAQAGSSPLARGTRALSTERKT